MKNLLTKITLHAILFSMAMQCTSNMLAVKPEPMNINFNGKTYTINAAEKENLYKEHDYINANACVKTVSIPILSIFVNSMIGMFIGGELRVALHKKIDSKIDLINVIGAIGFLVGLGIGCYYADKADFYNKAMHTYFAKKQEEYFASIQNNK
jgi:hypothetical protein